jgi:regulator of PEP synthase PpsR (kinase-PPPase family)
LQQCRDELAAAERLFRRHALPVLDTTRMSVEEIAAHLRVRP